MGGGIAQVAASTGHRVGLIDRTDQLLRKSEATIEANLKRKKDLDRDSVMSNIQFETDWKKVIGDAELVIEAVPEQVNLKKSLLTAASEHASANCLFASNTSSLCISPPRNGPQANLKEKDTRKIEKKGKA